MSAGPRGYVARSMRHLSRHTRKFVCISQYVQQLLQGYGIAADQCSVIHCATDTAVKKEHISSLREKMGIDLSDIVVGTTGIWRPNKGFIHFVQACEDLHRHLPQIKFFLGGKAYPSDIAYERELKDSAGILNAIGSLHYTGYVEDIGQFMSALDVFVLPSECEPFGLVLLEAMARGIPVIATQAGGAPEIVTHGETGLLVPPKKPMVLSHAMYSLICQPNLRFKLTAKAQAWVRERFNRAEMVKKYEALYTSLLVPKA